MVLSKVDSCLSALASDALQLAWEEGGGVIVHYDACKYRANGTPTAKFVSVQQIASVMPLLPPSVPAYTWMPHYKVNVAGPAVMLFIAGSSCTWISWIYSSTHIYMVDANGHSSKPTLRLEVSWDSLSLRSPSAFVIPTTTSIWMGVLVQVFLELTTILVMRHGAQWRA